MHKPTTGPTTGPIERVQLDNPLIEEIVRGCHSRLGRPLSPLDLEELVQDAMVAIWTADRTFRAEGHRDAWIYGIARHLLLKRLRTRRSRVGREDPLHPEEVGLATRERNAMGTGTAKEIRVTFAAAGTTVDTIFRLHSIEGGTFAQIADDLGMKETTVKARYYRSLPDLRRRLRVLFKHASD